MSLRTAVVLTLGLTLLAHAPAQAKSAPAAHRSLVLHGRASDEQGFPIPRAKVTGTVGRTTATAKADGAGQFTLTLPFVTIAELAHAPYTATVRCEARGWHFSVANAGAQLGLDLRLAAGPDTITRLIARSNDVNVAAGVVRAMSDASGTPAPVAVTFVASPGELVSDLQAPDLTQTAQMALPGARASMAYAPTPAPAPAPKATPPSSAAAAPGHPADAKSAKRAKADGTEPSGPWWARAMGDQPAAPGTDNADAKKALEESKGEQRSLAREEAKRLRDEAKDREKALRQQQAEERIDAQRRIREATAPDSSRVARRRREAEARAEAQRRKDDEAKSQKRWKAIVHDVNLVRGAADTLPAPPLSQLTEAAGEPASANARATKAPSRAVRAARDTVAARAPRPLPERVASPPPVERAPAVERRSVKIFPAPEGESRARAAPFVIRASGDPVPRPDAAPSDSCLCRVEGTVEVQSQNPLASRLRVSVALAWYPSACDTVELFMGSPRPFRLPPVPCGAQRLKVTVLARDHFAVTSRDALSGFRCDGGPVHQIRLVLAPR